MYEPVAVEEQLDINDSLDALVDEMTDCFNSICTIVRNSTFSFTEFGLFDWRQQLNPSVNSQDELMRWYASVSLHCTIPENYIELLIELYPDVDRHLAWMEGRMVPTREELEMLGLPMGGLGTMFDTRDMIMSQLSYFPRLHDGLNDAVLVGLLWHVMRHHSDQ